jgi:hypothetical protein
MIFALDFVRSLLTPVTDPNGPALTVQYFGVMYVASGFAAAYAFAKNRWPEARAYLAFAGPYVLLSLVLTLYAAATMGVTVISWLYVILSVIYLPIVLWTWRRESARTQAAQEQRFQQ